MLRRTALLFALLIGCAPLLAAPASATPHHEQEDGCDHGNSRKPCKEDPQPDRGKDCEKHGNHGGVNENHCLPTTTTTPPTPDSTSTTTSTVSPDTTGTTTATVPTTTPDAPATDTPNLGCVTPDGHPFVTNIEQGGCPPAIQTVPTPPNAPTLAKELPETGWDAGLLFVIGTALVLGGLSCWFAGKAIE